MVAKKISTGRLVSTCLGALLGACGPAEGVQVQELPELIRPSPEERAGLPELEGGWNHAGWVVAAPWMADELDAERAPRSVTIQAQRLDSISGYLLRAAGSPRFVGEVRRDGIISLLVRQAEESHGVVAGIVERDTLWLELSTLADFRVPPRARAAYVRAPVGQLWVRLPSGALLRDTAVMVVPRDTLLPGLPPAAQEPRPEATPPGLPEQPRPPVQPAPQPIPPAPQPRTPAPPTPATPTEPGPEAPAQDAPDEPDGENAEDEDESPPAEPGFSVPAPELEIGLPTPTG
jgi:hypothetical protein